MEEILWVMLKTKYMSKFNIEEVKAMGFAEQVAELDKQIQRVKDSRQQNAANIRHLEEVSENLNQQLETLIELKWSCRFQQRVNEVMDEVMDPDNEWTDKN